MLSRALKDLEAPEKSYHELGFVAVFFSFLVWVQCTLLMVHDKVGVPKPLPFLRVSGMETVSKSGDSQCDGGRVGAGEGLFLPPVLLLGLLV